jgi:hypothetical protein
MAFTPVDITRFGVLSAISVAASTDQTGVQKTDKASGLPLWKIQCLRAPVDGGRASLITIAVPSRMEPEIVPMAHVTPVDLVAIDWSMDGRSGLSFRAAGLEEA